MKAFLIITSIQLLIYVAMIVWAYFDLTREKKEGYITSVTIKKVFRYWLSVCYIPIFGPLCTLTIFIVAGLDTLVLKNLFVKTDFYNKFKNLLDKDV